jgi:hypothetical protein
VTDGKSLSFQYNGVAACWLGVAIIVGGVISIHRVGSREWLKEINVDKGGLPNFGI